MPNLNWSQLNHLQLGRYAEYYAKMEFASYGFDVYTSEVDDHGVDFVAKYNGVFYEIQVKAVRLDNYMYIRKDKIMLDDKFLICYLRFQDGFLPDVYVFPSTVWKTPNALFVDYSYDKPELKSKPEYGIKYNKRNAPLMEPYRAEAFFNKVAPDLSKFAGDVDGVDVTKLSEEEQNVKGVLK